MIELPPPSARALHVAALPFPTYQGTQAAISSMLEASSHASQRATLFTYATEGYSIEPSYTLHRTGNLPRVRSLRSGPSIGKLLLDARMLFELHALARKLKPSVVVAHHVEAASLALTLRNVRVVFFAHTDLAAELPVYGHPLLGAALGRAGAALDRALVRRAAAVATISESLRARLSHLRGDVHFVPIPWPVPEPIRPGERAESRLALGLELDAKLALYAGNLDAYQGVEQIPEALSMLRERGLPLRLLLATRSDARAFTRRCRELDVPVHACALGDEMIRRQLHAAADLAIVPRLSPGGLPIKLLDALARGVPAAVMPAACAGLPLTGVVERARDASSSALASAVERIVLCRERREELSAAGRAYIAREHNQARFLETLDVVLQQALQPSAAGANRVPGA